MTSETNPSDTQPADEEVTPPPDTLFCIYDFSVAPITYDVLQFLAICEAARHEAQLPKFHFLLFQEQDGSFRNLSKATDKDKFLTDDQKLWRKHHITEPTVNLVRSLDAVTSFSSREDARRFIESLPKSRVIPGTYTFEKPASLHVMTHVHHAIAQGYPVRGLHAPVNAKRTIQRFITNHPNGNRPIVTLTIRSSPVHPERNANLDAWMQFAHYLEERGYWPIAIPDTDIVTSERHEKLDPRATWYLPASLRPELRAALYEQSFLNMSCGGGPAFINLFLQSPRYLMIFKDYGGSISSKAVFEHLWGIPWGGPHKFDDGVKFVWQNDSFENLCASFQSMLEVIQ